jgi:hypothetical protein
MEGSSAKIRKPNRKACFVGFLGGPDKAADAAEDHRSHRASDAAELREGLCYRRSKCDAVDAAEICEAVTRPSRFVPIKSAEEVTGGNIMISRPRTIGLLVLEAGGVHLYANPAGLSLEPSTRGVVNIT